MTKSLRLSCISDTHGSHNEIGLNEFNSSDIIIHAGDMTKMGSFRELNDINQWFGVLLEPVICCAGNHDKWCEQAGYQLAKQLFSNATYLDNDLAEIYSIKIYGAPYSKKYGYWSYMLEEEDLNKEWAKIPENIDILIVHGPPFGILDKNRNGIECGSKTLRKQIFERIRPKLVVMGHIHENSGILKEGNITFVNAAQLDEWYNLTNKPIHISL